MNALWPLVSASVIGYNGTRHGNDHAVLNGGVDNSTVVSRTGLFVPDRYLCGSGAVVQRRVRTMFAKIRSRTCSGTNAPTVRETSVLKQLGSHVNYVPK